MDFSRIKNYLARNWKIILFLFVIALAIFLRVYNFSDWLFFKMDQSRDALLIRQALEQGPGWLPFLGPRAGGTDLNLGPAFYYFQYISAALFQSSHPAVLAYPDLLFGILSIPLFYLFAKKYFSRDWSMILASLYALCFLGIQYSRFAWNPNSLPFFNLLFFFSLLNVFDPKIKYQPRWVVLAGFSFAVSTQLHFLSFLTLPIVTFIFLLANKKNIGKYLNWKKALLFVLMVLVLYLPFFLNEIASNGENTRQFIAALGEKPSDHTLWEKFNRNIRYWGQHWFTILTGWISSKSELRTGALAWLGAMLPALYMGFRSWRQEKDSVRKNFLLVALLWFLVYFLVYVPVSYQIRPRFFMPLLALPFVFIGFLAVFFWNKKKKLFRFSVIGAILIVLIGNMLGTFFWFDEIREAQSGSVRPWRTIILKAKDGIVLWHLEKTADFVKDDCPGKIAYYDTIPEYRSPMKYLLAERGIEAQSLSDFSDEGTESQSCNYYFNLARREPKIKKKTEGEFSSAEAREFGAFKVYVLEPADRVEEAQEEVEEEDREDETGKAPRIFWRDLRDERKDF